MSSRTHLSAVVVRSVVIVAARDHFSAFDEDGTEGEAHRALGCRIGALREVELGLAHDDGLGTSSGVLTWSALRLPNSQRV